MKTYPTLLAIILTLALLPAQGTWQWSGRVHPELDWYTIETEHFNIHYHNGIEEIARQGASIAEQVWPTLLEQLEIEDTPKIDITFTAEDEITNGYALWTNMVFIWVDQNDVAIWLEDEKWLFQVVAHELQHIVMFNAIDTWMSKPWSFLISGTPGWFVEGMAEYYTEKWRPYRADLSHKQHVLKNEMDKMDPHHDGYSKLLYMGDRFGDSTLANLIHYRNKLKLFNFKKGFKKYTGISVKQFNEDWRRHMNTYYYGYRAQKETIEEIGEVGTLPIKEMQSFAFAPDSFRIALIGRDDKDQFDRSLYIATQDTARKKEAKSRRLFEWMTAPFHFKQDTTAEKEKKPKVKWNLEEIDYGGFGPGIAWSPGGTEIVYAKYHFGEHQSMVWDLRVAEVESGKGNWVTNSFRANHPDWSPSGKQIVFVAHANSTSNLFTIKPDGSDRKRITDFTEDTQILTPKWNSDGQQITFAKAGPDGNMDIYVLNIISKEITRITDNPEVDYLPVWHSDGSKITYTSHKGSTPNLHTVDLTNHTTIQNTDVGDALWSLQMTPKDSTIIALTLGDVDSVRIVRVDPGRSSTAETLSIRNTFISWRSRRPDLPLQAIDPEAPVDILAQDSYRFGKHIKHFISLALPYPDFSGALGITSFTDAMGRHLFQIGGGGAWIGDPNPWLFAGYLNAQHGPLWGINYFYNSRWNIRPYDRSLSGLYERLDGLQLISQIPINFGQSMSSNHILWGSFTFQNRTVIMPSDSLDESTGEYIPREPVDFLDLPVPEEGKEGIIGLNYRWLDRRPHRQNLVLPVQGKGVQIKINHANETVFGDFTYTRFSTDAFVNLPGGGPMAIFFRLKTLAMVGDPPDQEYVGLSRDPSIYLPVGIIEEGILGFQENHNPRGWDDIRLGDRLVFGSLEYRFPLIPELPINVFGFTLGSLTGAVISDFGNAWYVGKKQEEWVVTLGYELKVALQIEKIPLLFFSVGYAQTVDEWQANEEPVPYVQLALINPF